MSVVSIGWDLRLGSRGAVCSDQPIIIIYPRQYLWQGVVKIRFCCLIKKIDNAQTTYFSLVEKIDKATEDNIHETPRRWHTLIVLGCTCSSFPRLYRTMGFDRWLLICYRRTQDDEPFWSFITQTETLMSMFERTGHESRYIWAGSGNDCLMLVIVYHHHPYYHHYHPQ